MVAVTMRTSFSQTPHYSKHLSSSNVSTHSRH